MNGHTIPFRVLARGHRLPSGLFSYPCRPVDMKALAEPYGPIRFVSCDDAAVPIGSVVDAEKSGSQWVFRRGTPDNVNP